MNFQMTTVASAVIQVLAVGTAFLKTWDSESNSDPITTATWRRVLRSPGFYCLALATIFLAGRWPWLGINRELNPDESLFLANAWRYTQDIVPWRSTSSGTSGPLTPWLLTAMYFCGAPLNYTTAHITAACLQIATVCLAYGAIRTFSGETAARFATLPVAFLLSRTGDPNFVHLASENVPVTLMAGVAFAAAQAVRETAAEGTRAPWLFLAGLLAGGVAFSKAQALPIASVMSCVVVAALFVKPWLLHERLTLAGFFCAGGLALPATICGVIVLAGVGQEMCQSYVGANLAYGNPKTSPSLLQACGLVTSVPIFATMCSAVGVLTTVAVLKPQMIACPPPRWPDRSLLIASASLAVTALLCIARPGYQHPHYLLLLTLPCLYLSGISWGVILGLPDRNGEQRRPPIAILAVAALPLVLIARSLTVGGFVLEGDRQDDFLRRALKPCSSSQESQIAAALTSEHDTIAVWGWRPDIYVESKRMPAVRDVEPSGAILPGRYRDACRRRFLDDITENKPALFIDAVAHAGFPWLYGQEVVDRGRGA
jgi:hypothetical protein